ncbi:3266_t:CDS:2, partial [Scutellospora calospora]
RKSSDTRYSPNNPYLKGGSDSRNNDNDYGNYGRRDSRGNNDYGARNSESGGFGQRNYRGDNTDYRRGDNTDYRRGDNNDYRRGDNNDYRRSGPRNNRGESNEYGSSRGYRGGAGDRGRGRGSGGNSRRPGRWHSDQNRSNKSAEEGGFGSGNSWAEQQEQEEMSGKTHLPWESDANAEDAGRKSNSNDWNNSSNQQESEK